MTMEYAIEGDVLVIRVPLTKEAIDNALLSSDETLVASATEKLGGRKLTIQINVYAKRD